MNQQKLSSGSDDTAERKRKRTISNRESARRSRMKKSQHLDDLIRQAKKLQSENAVIRQKISATLQMYLAVESNNNVLKAQLMELTDRLRSLNSVLQIAQEASGLADALLEPWQIPCPMPPLIANSSDVFQF